MSYITGWIVVGIITLGIYKLFELFVGKKGASYYDRKIGRQVRSFYVGEQA